MVTYSTVDYIVVEPEVAGGMGEGTLLDQTTHPPIVTNLHYRFDGWLGDALLTTFPCYIATALSADHLVRALMTGFKVDPVQISKSEKFKESPPGRNLPPFVWLRIWGIAGVNDLGLLADNTLVLSQDALALFARHWPCAR